MPVLRKTINYFANINKYSKSKLTEIGGYYISDLSVQTDDFVVLSISGIVILRLSERCV